MIPQYQGIRFYSSSIIAMYSNYSCIPVSSGSPACVRAQLCLLEWRLRWLGHLGCMDEGRTPKQPVW